MAFRPKLPLAARLPAGARQCRPEAADVIASVTALTTELSSFQHCQNSGTSRCASQIRTNDPSSMLGRASASGNIPQPRPAATAAPNPSAVGIKCTGRRISRRKTLRINMSCSASSRFHASDGARPAACAVNPFGRYLSIYELLATGM